VGTTAETVIKLLIAIYGKSGCFLMVERAARVIIFTLFLELYSGVDQIDDIDTSQQVIDKYARNSPSHKPLTH